MKQWKIEYFDCSTKIHICKSRRFEFSINRAYFTAQKILLNWIHREDFWIQEVIKYNFRIKLDLPRRDTFWQSWIYIYYQFQCVFGESKKEIMEKSFRWFCNSKENILCKMYLKYEFGSCIYLPFGTRQPFELWKSGRL